MERGTLDTVFRTSRCAKMLVDIKPLYFWKGMKRDAIRFVAGCFECERVKTEHQHPAGLLQPHANTNWKWQIINMDFVQCLPMIRNGHNAILIVVDRLTKVADFIPGNLTDGAIVFARKFVQEIFCLHGVPKKIISGRDARMTRQIERVNQVLEEQLRMYCMDQQYKWEDYLPLVEFSYNNSYQSAIKMVPFGALYRRRCRTPINWDKLEDRITLRPKMLIEMEEQVKLIRQKLAEANDR